MSKIKRGYRRIRTAFRVLHLRKLFKDLDPNAPGTITDDLETVVDRFGDKTAFIFEGSKLSYRQYDARANRVAHWASAQGLARGDVVALDLENCPDFAAIWFGLSKLGVATALINTNLEGDGLAHCIAIVDARAVIAAGTQAAAVKACLAENSLSIPLWDLDGAHGEDLAAALENQPAHRPDPALRSGLLGGDLALYIYTSGTTGLPKAARITHLRLRGVGRLAKALVKVGERDVVYNALPLYHITGGGIGLVGPLLVGATLVLRRRFSASGFWDDVGDSGATLFVYIGELCRYLISAPSHPKETSHALRAGFGNGLRGDVWQAFVDRFQVPTMRELYGSTEGNVTFLNFDGTVGSIGMLSPNLGKRMGVELVKFDIVEERPVRGPDGFCIRADVDEPGEAIGRIVEEGGQRFEGYQDKAATEAKILTDVFEKGDRWFRTGDLIRRDADHNLFFVDRVGDTFRWKGENVATNEVADAFARCKGVELANVYGIAMPGHEGRAGMAAITVGEDFAMDGLAPHLARLLPAYAVPLFIRIQQEADTTGTFKLRKVELVKQGFDLGKIDEPVWFLEPGTSQYRPFTPDLQARIEQAAYRF